MRAPLPLLALLLATPAAAQVDLSAFAPTLPKTMREVMIDTLDSTQVQTLLHVTGTQRDLAKLRTQRRAVEYGLDMAKDVVLTKAGTGSKGVSFDVVLSPGRSLYPFLAENQLRILRREALRTHPMQAVGTDEVAFALGLSAAERTHLQAFYTNHFRRVLQKDPPSMQVVKKALAEIAASQARRSEKEESEGYTVEGIASVRQDVRRLYAAMERATVLAAKEKWPGNPDPLPLLTPAQRARYRALSKG